MLRKTKKFSGKVNTKKKKIIPATRMKTALIINTGQSLANDAIILDTCSEMLGFGVNKTIPG